MPLSNTYGYFHIEAAFYAIKLYHKIKYPKAITLYVLVGLDLPDTLEVK